MTTNPSRHFFSKTLSFFYLGTPFFIGLDVVAHANIRVAALDEFPKLKMLYYFFCCVIGLLYLKNPLLASLATMFECSLSIILLTLSVFAPYYALLRKAAETTATTSGGPTDFRFSLLNFAISSTVLLISFYRNPIFEKSGSSSTD